MERGVENCTSLSLSSLLELGKGLFVDMISEDFDWKLKFFIKYEIGTARKIVLSFIMRK